MNKQRLTASAMRLECCAATISIPTNHDTETWALSKGTSKLFVANSFPVCFVNYVILGGGGANPPRPRKEVVQHADLGSKCAFVHHLLQVLYRLSMQDSSATWLTTEKHPLWIAITKQSNPPISLFRKTAYSEKGVNNMAWYHVENHIWVQKSCLTETSSFSTDCKISDQSPQTSYFSFLREN